MDPSTSAKNEPPCDPALPPEKQASGSSMRFDKKAPNKGISVGRASFSNVQAVQVGEKRGLKHKAAISIFGDLHQLTDGWPNRVNGRLFVIRFGDDEPSIRMLDTVDSLFAWIYENVPHPHWHKENFADVATKEPVTPLSRREFFEYLKANAEPDYFSVERFPHEPRLPGTYYLDEHFEWPESDGGALADLRVHLNAETELDRDLLMAAAITPGWGGEPGCRPAFMLTSRHGRGVGKTETARLFAALWGGPVELNEREDWPTMAKAIMNDKDAGRRCILIDNIKRHLGSGGLESLITADEVSGHLMFVGYRKKPNFYVTYMTANTPRLSFDLIDRSVVIEIGPSRHDNDWKAWAVEFLRTRQSEFIRDCLEFLARPPRSKIPRHLLDRWSPWQKSILARFPNGAELAAHIANQRKEFQKLPEGRTHQRPASRKVGGGG
jgi:hypothetical protein